MMKTLERIVLGLGSAGKLVHKDIYRAAMKLLVDTNMTVRCSASKVSLHRLHSSTADLWSVFAVRSTSNSQPSI